MPVIAAAQQATPIATTVWDLPLGAHARQLPTEAFIDFACGTHAGPPALKLTDWTDFARCEAEPGTGYHEVYFRYDDEPEYRARAMNYEAQVSVYQYTQVYDVPVIAGALFDADGFMVGLRLASDPRVPTEVRENGSSLAGFLMARFGEGKFACVDHPRGAEQDAYQGIYINQACDLANAPGGLDIHVEAHQFRKAGQAILGADGNPTRGLFESTTFFEAILHDPIMDRAGRLAALPVAAPTDKDRLVERARNCPGCDLRGVDLKRADLTGANLAGADLTGANLHAANLQRADLTGAKLTDANVNRADFRLAKLADAVLTEALLYATKFDGADLTRANLNGVHGSTAEFTRANLTGAMIQNADLRRARLNDANFGGADLSVSALDDAQMTRANLADAKVIQATFWRTTLAEANMTRVDARGADLFGANLREANLTGADFSYSRMTTVNLHDAITDGAKFVQTMLPAGFVPPALPSTPPR